MDRVRITTAQNVHIDFEAAGIGDRTIAAMIDYGILLAYLIGISILFSEVLSSTALLVLLILPYSVYFLLSEVIFDGQSIGKKVRGIKVARLDGKQPSTGDYLLRWLFRLIEIDLTMGMLAIITMFVKADGQRLGDAAAGTVVVRLAPRIELSDTLYASTEEDYRAQHDNIDVLTEEEMRLVREVLDALKNNANQADVAARRLTEMLKNKMSVSSPLTPREFLESLILDYNHTRRNSVQP